MTTSNSPSFSSRRWRLHGARLGAAASAVMLVLSVGQIMGAGALPPGTAATPGQSLSVQSGTAATTFGLNLAAGNSTCPGDSATGGYRWNTYFVPESVDPAVLTYGATGPVAPAGVTFTFPLRSSANATLVNKNTAPSTAVVINIGVLSFNAFTSFDAGVPNGVYKIGIACTLNGNTERFWETRVTFSGDPKAFSWTTGVDPTVTTTTAAGATTTSAAAASTTVAGATTTVAGGATTTTLRATTTTVAAGATTTTAATGATTTSVAGATTTTVAGATVGATTTTAFVSSFPVTGGGTGSGSTSGTSGGGSIPVTGRSPLPVVVWGLLLLVFGRMAILLARPVGVIPVESR